MKKKRATQELKNIRIRIKNKKQQQQKGTPSSHFAAIRDVGVRVCVNPSRLQVNFLLTFLYSYSFPGRHGIENESFECDD